MAIKINHKQDVNVALLLSEHDRKQSKIQPSLIPLKGMVSHWDDYVLSKYMNANEETNVCVYYVPGTVLDKQEIERCIRCRHFFWGVCNLGN